MAKEPSNKGRNKNLGIDYNEIKNKYIMSSLTLQELATQYGIKTSTLQHYASIHGWSKEKKEYKDRYRSKVKKKLQDDIIENEVEINKRHYTIWNQLLDVVQEIFKDKKAQLQYDNGKYNVNKLSQIATILVQTQNGQRLSAGLIEASKMKELDLTKERTDLEKKKLEPNNKVVQDVSFLKALSAVGKELWKNEKVPQEPKKEEKENE